MAYDTGRSVSMGGPIVRVDFEPDHTLVVIRVVNEENCAFLQDNKAALLKQGLDPTRLAGALHDRRDRGQPHKTNKQKVLMDSLNVLSED